jgi:hypothetical protein
VIHRDRVTIPPFWIGQLFGYCVGGECDAREVTVTIKNHEATPVVVLPRCPLCAKPLDPPWRAGGWLRSRAEEGESSRWPRLAALARQNLAQRRAAASRRPVSGQMKGELAPPTLPGPSSAS